MKQNILTLLFALLIPAIILGHIQQEEISGLALKSKVGRPANLKTVSSLLN